MAGGLVGSNVGRFVLEGSSCDKVSAAGPVIAARLGSAMMRRFGHGDWRNEVGHVAGPSADVETGLSVTNFFI